MTAGVRSRVLVTLLHSACSLTALAGVARAQSAPALPRGTVVAANMDAASASVVDVATGRALATIPTVPGPHEVAISGDGRWAVVSGYGNRQAIGSSLLVIDVTGAAAPRTIELGSYLRPHGMRFLPGDKQLVVTSEATKNVLLVDFAAGRVDTAISTGQPATHMVVTSADGRFAFTTNISAGSVSRIDLARRRLDTTFVVGARIEGIGISPDGREVWVAGNESHLVYVLDAARGTILDTLGGFGFPYRIGFTPDGKTAVVSDPGAEKVQLIDVATRKPRAVIDMSGAALVASGGGPSPQGVTISKDGATAYVTLKAAGRVAVIDIATARVLTTLTVGGGSDGIGVSQLVR